MRLLKRTSIDHVDHGIYAYLAGVLDSDGSFIMVHRIRYGKEFYDTYIQVTNSNENLMKWLVKTFGGSYRDKTKYKQSSIPRIKNIFEWKQQRTRDLVPILEKAVPYLIIKKEKGEKMLKYRKSRLLLANG